MTEQDLINLRTLAEQQKNQRGVKIKNGILKQTHDVKLSESLSLITKKLDTFNESTKKLGKVKKESNLEKINIKALPNSSNFSDPMREMIGSLLRSKNSLKITQGESRRANILGVTIQISGADTIRTNENVYELTPEICKSLSDTGYTGKNMKNESDFQ